METLPDGLCAVYTISLYTLGVQGQFGVWSLVVQRFCRGGTRKHLEVLMFKKEKKESWFLEMVLLSSKSIECSSF